MYLAQFSKPHTHLLFFKLKLDRDAKIKQLDKSRAKINLESIVTAVPARQVKSKNKSRKYSHSSAGVLAVVKPC